MTKTFSAAELDAIINAHQRAAELTAKFEHVVNDAKLAFETAVERYNAAKREEAAAEQGTVFLMEGEQAQVVRRVVEAWAEVLSTAKEMQIVMEAVRAVKNDDADE